MAEERAERRLAAILAADVVGYSRLTEIDEEGTIARFKKLRQELVEPIIDENRGRLVKLMGDGALVEFASAVDAVRCAMEVQRSMAEYNGPLPADQRIALRIGINLGDIVIDGDDILGDGVNLAARLEALADPGGVCISDMVHQSVSGKLDLTFADLGEQQVKNIAKPVHAYKILLDAEAAGTLVAQTRPSTRRWRIPAVAAALVVAIAAGGLAWWQPWAARVEPASVDRMAFPLPEKPSIAVLPFANLTGDPKQDYLGDGISENINTALSRIADMFVIAGTSTLPYKGKPVKVQQVAEDLGVRYVLEGSVQRSGDKVRITAKLIDALSGRYLWGNRYDRDLQDAFALQDDITLNVLTALEVKLTEGEIARILRGNTKNLEAYQLVKRGYRLFLRFTKEDNTEARRLLQRAVGLDPNYAVGWSFLGLTYQQSASFGWGEDPAQDEARAIELAHKALAIDPSFGGPYNLLANISLFKQRYDEAIAYSKKAVALTPNSSALAALLGRTLVYVGRPDEALQLIQRAIRLNPNTPPNVLRFEGQAYLAMGRNNEAIAAFERARARNPKSPLPLAFLALTYAYMGRMEQANAAAQEVLKVSPSFSAKGFVNVQLRYKDKAVPERALATLHQLGLPD